MTEALQLESKEELLHELKERVGLRNRMCGALYWNVTNDECCQIASKYLDAGGDRRVIEQLLGEGNFR